MKESRAKGRLTGEGGKRGGSKWWWFESDICEANLLASSMMLIYYSVNVFYLHNLKMIPSQYVNLRHMLFAHVWSAQRR